MSYFWLELGRRDAPSTDFDAIYRDLAPVAAQGEVLRNSTAGELSTRAAVYVEPKAIDDVTITGPDGSWLMLIGTPLERVGSGDDEQRLLTRFFEDPRRTLRDGILGNFAALAYDARGERAFAATDYTNTIPIFFARTGTSLYFASHELALARALRSELDAFGVAQFINFGATWDSWTRFRGIEKLTACQHIAIDRDLQGAPQDYWVPADETVSAATFDEELGRWVGTLTTMVDQFLVCSDADSVMSDFTAGEDARLVVAAAHAAGLPLEAFVSGSDADIDVIVAKRAALQAGLDLIHRERRPITQQQIEEHGLNIVAQSDGYRDLFLSFTHFATDASEPLDPRIPKFSGIPGGEAFRGAYYLRGKALRPDASSRLDLPSFMRWKYYLDTAPGLVRVDHGEFLATVNDMAARELEQVRGFPIGTQIDHMIRAYQTLCWALKYRDPRYLPLATGPMTRSMYSLRPGWKKGGRLTRASIETMWPQLALVKTQLGVPTIRKTLTRQHLFLPEYWARARRYSRGINQRVLKLSQPKKFAYSFDLNASVLDTLLNREPFSEWFESAETMLTGPAYAEAALNTVLRESRHGTYKSLPILQRVLSQELALRWVHGK